MTVGIFITARLGSSRLKKKHLLPVMNQTMISVLLSRILNEFQGEISRNEIKIAVTSTQEQENREFLKILPDNVSFFQGSKYNIPLRHLEAANAYGVDAIVSVDGDDILCAAEAMRSVYDALVSGHAAAMTEGLPLGMNAWGYSTAFLNDSLKGNRNEVLETGWGRIFDMSAFTKITYNVPDYSDSLRYTLDYEEDFAFFSNLIETYAEHEIQKASWENIIECTLLNSFESLNKIRIDEYWANFEQERNRDMQSA